jgi:mannose-6-phosphate isomerase-like protein (cupin superfamily)
MEYCIQEPASSGPVTELMACPEFRQRILSVTTGEATERCDDERDEVLYVLAGTGRVTIGGDVHDLEPGNALFVARGTAWSVDEADGLRVLSVLVEEPLAADATHAVIATGERGTATAGREFDLFAHPDNGCASVTQFVGHIPPGRAPDHFHRYDEVGYILSGVGAFHVGGESAPLGPGSCFHLPARLVHALENFGPGEMQVLGVFRPAGSPAEAYYPDGTAAVVPVEA